MKNFNKFTLQHSEMILGGELYVTTCGTERCDIYDSDRHRIIYID